MFVRALIIASYCASLSFGLSGFWAAKPPKTNYKCLETPNTNQKVNDAMPKCSESVKANIIAEAFAIIRHQWQHGSDAERFEHHHLHHHHHHPPSSPAISADLVRHVHSIHRLPGHQHAHQADYPPYPPSLKVDPRHPIVRPIVGTASSSDSAGLDANSYYEYQHFSAGGGDFANSLRRSLTDPEPGWLTSGPITDISMQEKRIAGCLLHCIFSKNHAVDALGWPTLDGLVAFFSEGVHDHEYFLGALRSVNVCLGTLSQAYRVQRWRSPEHGQSCDLSFDVFNCVADRLGDFCEVREHRTKKP